MADAPVEDGPADNWEDLEDSGELDKRLNDIKPKSKKEITNSVVQGSGDGIRNMPMLQEEGGRTQFQPTVKILKRQPNSDMHNSNSNRGPTNKPAKTLEQREAEYAEARMRIFGNSASSSSEKDDSPTQENRPPRLMQQFEDMKVSDNVCRQPRGPDGSKGFNLQR